MAEEVSKFSIDGRDATQAKYKVFMQPGKEKIEFVEVELTNGRKAVDSFVGLSREDATKVLGPKNLEKIEKGVGIDKDSISNDGNGLRSYYEGRLEKRALEPYLSSSIGLEEKRQNPETSKLVDAVRDLAIARERVSKLVSPNLPLEQSAEIPPRSLLANAEESREKLAAEGAKELALVGRFTLDALKSKGEEKESFEQNARRTEIAAYDKLALVSEDRARALIDAEKRAHFKDNQLLASAINFNPQLYQKSVYAQQLSENRIPALDSVAKELTDLKAPSLVEVDKEQIKQALAIEGARELGQSRKLGLEAMYSDTSSERQSGTERANLLEQSAYSKLAAVNSEQASKLVVAERENYKHDPQLADSIKFDPALHQKAQMAQQSLVKGEPEQSNTIEQFDKGRLMDAEVRRNLEHLNRVKNAERDSDLSNLSKSRNQVQNVDAMADYNQKPSATKQVEKQVDENIRKIPDEIEKKYIKIGDTFHYVNKPDLKAFEDRGNKLETKSNSEHVAADLVNIAKARGWEDIKVNGTEEFRRQVWLEASVRGMGVKGYQPKEADLALLEKRNRDAKTNSIENADQRVKDRQEGRSAEKPTLARDGERNSTTISESAKETAAKEKADAIRENNRAAAAKKYPELVGALAVVAAGEKFAKENLKSTSDRMRFNQLTRETIASSVEKGERLPEIKVKDTFQEKQKPDQVLSR